MNAVDIESAQLMNISYLRARDPSIVTGHFQLQKIRINLFEKQFNQETKYEGESNTLQTYLRIKPTKTSEQLYKVQNENTLICKVPQSSYAMRNIREGDKVTRKYTFSKIFDVNTNQTELFNSIVKERILNFINGKHCTILTYGASGSGKTYTIAGTDTEPGIIPRALEYLFRTLPELSEIPQTKPEPNGNVNTCIDAKREREFRQNILRASSTLHERNTYFKTYQKMQKNLNREPVGCLDEISDLSLSVWVSFAEIYNERIYDLLLPEPPRGKERKYLRLGKSNDKVYIKELTQVNVVSGIEAYEILQYGLHNLKFASTNINAHSSRSHSIFTIKLAQASTSRKSGYVSCLNFCDLAGSERLKKTKNIGDRLKESNNINTSLMVLGKCISLVREAQKYKDQRLIPFRESKLTQLFQNALMGYEDISLIVNINPAGEMFDETQHVLNFSAIAKNIIVEPQQKTVPVNTNNFTICLEKRNSFLVPVSEESSELEFLRNEVARLQEEVEYEREESEINEVEARREVSETYNKIIESIRAQHEKEKYRQRVALQKQHKMEMELLKEQLPEDSIICLDSSSEDDDNSGDTKEQKWTVEHEILKCELEVVKKNYQIETGLLNKKLDELNHNYLELLRIIDESITSYDELTAITQQEISTLKAENLALEDKVAERDSEISYLKSLSVLKMTDLREVAEESENLIEFSQKETTIQEKSGKFYIKEPELCTNDENNINVANI